MCWTERRTTSSGGPEHTIVWGVAASSDLLGGLFTSTRSLSKQIEFSLSVICGVGIITACFSAAAAAWVSLCCLGFPGYCKNNYADDNNNKITTPVITKMMLSAAAAAWVSLC